MPLLDGGPLLVLNSDTFWLEETGKSNLERLVEAWDDNKYDIVIGPVADDNMALLFRQYENEIIDFQTLLKGMVYKKTSSQYSFHTEKSIRLLRKVED